MKKMKVFDIQLNDQEGITAVALVNVPAIESNFVAFASQEAGIKLAKDEHEQIVTGPVLIPDMLIMRIDKQSKDPFYVRFSKDVIKQLMLKFMKEKLIDSTNEEHDERKLHKDIFMFESVLIKNEEMADSFEKIGLEKLPVGSWVASFKIENKDTFNKVLSGDLKGFSIEGYMDMAFEPDREDYKKDLDLMKMELELINK